MCCVSLLLHSSFLPFCFYACSLTQAVGSHVDVCPRPCSSRHRMGQVRYTPTQRTTAQCAVRALSPCLALLSPHVCVTAKRLGSLRWLAHAAGHWYWFLLFHLYPHGFLCLIVSAETWVSSVRVATLVFRPFKRQRGIKQNSRRDMCVQVPCERS